MSHILSLHTSIRRSALREGAHVPEFERYLLEFSRPTATRILSINVRHHSKESKQSALGGGTNNINHKEISIATVKSSPPHQSVCLLCVLHEMTRYFWSTIKSTYSIYGLTDH